jgi:hypothetical protein
VRIAVIVPFLDEARHLPALLASLAAQVRLPDRLVLVDDGSSDASPAIADAFARRHAYATTVRLPIRPAASDRLAGAHELHAFAQGMAALPDPCDVVAKLDADLRLPPGALAAIEARFVADPRLGICGPRLRTVDATGRDVSHHTRPEHVEGAAKFYRWACWKAIAPLPPILGWDTIDEVRSRMRGWRTAGGDPASEPVLHVRPMGAHDGALRARVRWGRCAYAFGEHPLHALLFAARQAREPPVGIGAAAYLAGCSLAALRRAPRAEPELRAYVRADQLHRIAGRVRGRPTRPAPAGGSDAPDGSRSVRTH